jgi:hypothetical protein
MTTPDRVPRATLVSVVPNLRSRAGHHWDYNLSVGRAAESIGLRHEAAIPSHCDWEGIPAHWHRCLAWRRDTAATGWARSWDTAVQAWRLLRSLSGWLARRPTPADPDDEIVFVDDFLPIQLGCVALAMLVSGRGRRSAWILYRYNTAWVRAHVWWHRWCLGIADLATDGHVRLLTDSEAIAESLGSLLQRPVQVVPIPHTSLHAKAPRAGSPDTAIRCWWPGPPRPPKGPQHIAALLRSTLPEAARLTVVAARSSGFAATGGGPRLDLIDDALSRDDYLAEFSRTDIVLLPYDAAMYAESTSGIFVEAVMFGAIPVVTRSTWMAGELAPFGLERLAIDWERRDLARWLADLPHDVDLRTRLAALRDHYLAYHSESGYADALRLLRAAPAASLGPA